MNLKALADKLPKIGELPGSWRTKHDRISPALARTLYTRALELAREDVSPVSVSRKLSASYSLSLSPGTVRHWMVGDRRSGTGTSSVRNIFREEPSPALSYIIGANKGDGCTLARSGVVKLEVTDKDFAQAFNENMATLFSRGIPNKISVRRRVGRLPMYVVKYASRQLLLLLRQPLKELLELAAAFPREFLRGFFDAEGHVDVGIRKHLILLVGAENSNRKMLFMVRRMLKGIGIDSRINQKRKAGSVKVIRGKPFKMRRTSYSLIIGKIDQVKRFAAEVGFSIHRKAEKLKDALSVIKSVAPMYRASVWKGLYFKQGGEWVKQQSPSLVS